MTEMDSTRILTPLSPTYMPYFPPHRSPLNSSSNTRQREDYEFSSECCSSSPSPQVTVTLTDDEDGEGPVINNKPDRLTEGYPAWELPFASEPALEGELEQGLPPLKKLKPDKDHLAVVGSGLDNASTEGIVLISAVKGILTKRDSSSTPQSPSASSPICPDTCFMPWSRGAGGLGLTASNFSTPHHSSTPLSRRSSSGASSGCAGSLKAVRFASGNGLPHALGGIGLGTNIPILPGQVEGPVAAIMYLTHSAEAYDRSPIIVENGLRLPPRAKPDDEEEDGTTTEPVKAPKSPTSPQKKRRVKPVVLELAKISQAQLCPSPEVLSPRGESEQETSIIIKPSLVMNRTYRDIEEVDEEEEEEGAAGAAEEEEEADDENEEDGCSKSRQGQQAQDDNSDDEEEDHHHQSTRTMPSSLSASASKSFDAQWGLGKWSSGEVFGCCDALGGF
ncbi:hypothetical protein PCANC_21669 [Puccinia coronata f. sp. avenae]|uniref:Uncharacterized protein n=1 Tax=Puccinia coronata f. sp. avenae TaxID=200324 RepID=A0A2N5SXA6_9BASI|nr:hypothetical protein PCANC_21669 [Puccinia coronata f. sp. avenae]PLW17868.1 hypothetical protein PCASD_19692 [Puccinia coronata f. sp. avenae]PLW51036.1 hypothetical protein PCASD_02428 [Puccinia coronata f. sp. avenae]